MQKVNIVHLVYSMNDGGAQKVILNYLEDMKGNDKFHIELVCLYNQFNEKYQEEIEKLGIKVTTLIDKRSKHKSKKINKISEILKINKELMNYLDKNKVDILHIHLCPTIIYSYFALMLKKVPLYFYTVHSSPLRFSGIKLCLMRNFLRRKNVITICLNNEQLKMAKEHYKIRKGEIIHNGVDFLEIEEKIISQKEARRQLNLGDDFIVAAVGRLDPIKRFDFLIKIFFDVQKKVKKAKLVIAGEGQERKKLMDMVEKMGLKENVIFLGNLKNVVPLFCAADVLAVTSESETASLVFLEAQKCNLRCVISDGVPEESIITNNVVKMKATASIEEWADAIVNTGQKTALPLFSFADYESHSISEKMETKYLEYWSKEGKRTND